MQNRTFLFLIILLQCFTSCNKNRTSINKSTLEIDLSIIRNKSITSFKIESDGNTTVLVNEINDIGYINQVHFNNEEMTNIENEIDKISLIKCDTSNFNYADGLRYVMIFKKLNLSKTFISGTCNNLKPLDSLVLKIMNMYNKKDKKPFFNSINVIKIPSFPNSVSVPLVPKRKTLP